MPTEDVSQILDPADILVVPDCSPGELALWAKQSLRFTAFDSNFLRWNFIRGLSGRMVQVRARWFEVVTYAPRKRVETQEILEKFQGLCADGNTGVFLSWIAKQTPSGYFATILPEDFRYRADPSSSQVCIPYFYNDHGNCILSLDEVTGTWSDDWTFVACRERPSLTPFSPRR